MRYVIVRWRYLRRWASRQRHQFASIAVVSGSARQRLLGTDHVAAFVLLWAFIGLGGVMISELAIGSTCQMRSENSIGTITNAA